MNRPILIVATLALLGLAACDKPTVVNVPPPVAGPAGPAGATGATGGQGETGKAGTDTTVIVMPPPASAASN